MKKNFLFFKKYLFLTALLCLGIIRSDLAWNNARLFGAAKYDDYHVVSCGLDAGWGYNLSLGKQWKAFSYIGLGLPKWDFYRTPITGSWERGRNWNLVFDLGIGYRL